MFAQSMLQCLTALQSLHDSTMRSMSIFGFDSFLLDYFYHRFVQLPINRIEVIIALFK